MSGRAFAAMLPLLLLVTAETARAGTDEDFRAWYVVVAQGSAEPVSPKLAKWRWWLEGQARFRDDAGTFDQGFVRPGIGYTIRPRTTLWAGYGWFRTSPAMGSDFDEHRIWQQLTWSTELALVTLSTRTRLEQRFVDTGDDVGWRFRQQISLRWPLWGRFSLFAFDEIFLNFNSTDWGAGSGFDQNRFFIGPAVDLDRDGHVRLEVGYLNQYVRQPRGDNQMNHVLVVGLKLNY